MEVAHYHSGNFPVGPLKCLRDSLIFSFFSHFVTCRIIFCREGQVNTARAALELLEECSNLTFHFRGTLNSLTMMICP